MSVRHNVKKWILFGRKIQEDNAQNVQQTGKQNIYLIMSQDTTKKIV